MSRVLELARNHGVYSGWEEDDIYTAAMEQRLHAFAAALLAEPLTPCQLSERDRDQAVGGLIYHGNSVSHWFAKACAYRDRVGEAYKNGYEQGLKDGRKRDPTDAPIDEVWRESKL